MTTIDAGEVCAGCGAKIPNSVTPMVLGSTVLCPACYHKRTTAPAPAPAPARKGSAIASAIALAALACALLALVLTIALGLYVFLRPGEVPGKSLSAYDLSTPQSAVKSMAAIKSSGDLKAMMQLEVKTHDDPTAKAIAETVAVDRTLDYDGKTLVLFTYRKGGLEFHDTQWLKKSGDIYVDTYVPTYDWGLKSDEQRRILSLISAWKAKDNPQIHGAATE